MNYLRIVIIAIGLLSFISCSNNNPDVNKDDKEIHILSPDSSKSGDSDYQNQTGRRANSDTIGQSDMRPDSLRE